METAKSKIRGLIYGQYQSQQQLAIKIGWSSGKLSRITSGKQMPSIQEAYELAEGLGVDVKTIVDIFCQ